MRFVFDAKEIENVHVFVAGKIGYKTLPLISYFNGNADNCWCRQNDSTPVTGYDKNKNILIPYSKYPNEYVELNHFNGGSLSYSFKTRTLSIPVSQDEYDSVS